METTNPPRQRSLLFEGRLPFLAFATLSIAITLTLFTFPGLWDWVLGPIHYAPPLYPFLDMHGRLAHMEMHALGWDVYERPNPIDPLHRLNNKPRITLLLGEFGLGTRHLVPLSAACILVFLGAVVALIRPQSWRGALVGLACTLSPPVLLLLERANDDIVLFSLLAPLPFLLASPRISRWICGFALLCFTFPVKFYPVAAIAGFAFRAPGRWRAPTFLAGGVAATLAYASANYAELAKLSGRVPDPAGIMTFGAETVFISHQLASFGSTFRWLALAATIAACALILVRSGESETEDVHDYRQYAFIIGTAILSFCFFLNTNWDYRMVYFLFTLPHLIHLCEGSNKGDRITSYVLIALLLLALYLEYACFAFAKASSPTLLKDLLLIHTLRQSAIWILLLGCIFLSAKMLRPSLQNLLFPSVRPENRADSSET